jgi:hypothetical protein
MLWPSVDRPCGQSAPDATTPLRFVGVSRNRLRASAGFELFLGVQRQLDHALEQLIGR